jgi:hypothetical protein
VIHPSGTIFERTPHVVAEAVAGDDASDAAASSIATEWTVVRHDLQGAQLIGRFYHRRLAQMIAEGAARSRQLPTPAWVRDGDRWIALAGPIVRFIVAPREPLPV